MLLSESGCFGADREEVPDSTTTARARQLGVTLLTGTLLRGRGAFASAAGVGGAVLRAVIGHIVESGANDQAEWLRHTLKPRPNQVLQLDPTARRGVNKACTLDNVRSPALHNFLVHPIIPHLSVSIFCLPPTHLSRCAHSAADRLPSPATCLKCPSPVAHCRHHVAALSNRRAV